MCLLVCACAHSKPIESLIPFSPGYFLSPSAEKTFLQIIVATFTDNVNSLINGEDISSPVVFDVAISFIQAVSGSLVRDPELEKSIIPSIFIFSYLPSSQHHGNSVGHPSPSQQTGIALWQDWLKSASEGSRSAIVDVIKGQLRHLVDDPKVFPLCVILHLIKLIFLTS